MSVDQLPFAEQLPMLAIAAGVLLLLFGQRDRLKSLVAGWWPAKTTATNITATMQPAERFAMFYALRTWCEAAGHAQAVKALDAQVLPTIVRDAAKEGGSTT